MAKRKGRRARSIKRAARGAATISARPRGSQPGSIGDRSPARGSIEFARVDGHANYGSIPVVALRSPNRLQTQGFRESDDRNEFAGIVREELTTFRFRLSSA